MIGRLKGTLIHKQPLSAPSWMAGQGLPEPASLRQGWQQLLQLPELSR
jgi:hypothetical protein